MRPSTSPTVIVITVLSGCLLGNPLQEGTYRIAAEGIFEDTCGLEFTAADIENELVTLEWVDGETLKMKGADATTEWDWDGDEFSRIDSAVTDQIGDCYLMLNTEFVGTVQASDLFWMTGYFSYATEGDCSGVDTDGIPCSYEIDYTGTMVD